MLSNGGHERRTVYETVAEWDFLEKEIEEVVE